MLVLVQASEPEAQVVMLCARPEVAGPLHLCTCAHCACKLHIQFIVHIYAHNANLCSLCTFVLMMHTCAQWCIFVLIVHFCAPIFSSYNAWTTCSCCYTWPRLYSITNILLKIMQFCHHVFHYPVCKRRLLDLGKPSFKKIYIILKNEPVPHYIWRNHIIFLDSAFPLYAQSSNKYLSITITINAITTRWVSDGSLPW